MCLGLEHKKYRLFLIVSLASFLAFSPLLYPEASAQEDSLMLEKEQNWPGCIPGGHNVLVEDIDGDDVVEILTGGFTYGGAMLRIWSWDGETLTLEKDQEWKTTMRTGVLGVYASDVDGDGDTEIVTAGYDFNGTIRSAQLTIWRWDGDALILEGSQEWCTVEGAAEPAFGGSASASCVYVSDVDGDGSSEMVTGGRAYDDTRSNAQLRIWFWDGDTLVLEKSHEWCTEGEAIVNSVYAYDVDGDGVTEIITSGFDDGLENSSGQLRIWSWNGETLTLEKSREWQIAEGTALDIAGNVMGNTIAAAVKAGDVDSDGFVEIVTGGFTYDGAMANGQLRIWSWDGGTLTLEGSHEWYTANITEVKSVCIEDIDGDGKLEIVTSGFVGNPVVWPEPEGSMGQLRVWSWDGKTLALENSRDWTVGDSVGAWNVDAGDVDKDGVAEITTVGCMSVGVNCSGHMRIWSAYRELTPPPYGLYIAVATVAIVIAFAGAYLYVRKKPKKT